MCGGGGGCVGDVGVYICVGGGVCIHVGALGF